MNYYFAKTLYTNFDTAVEKTYEALKSEGFGVLTVIDIHEKIKEKLNKDFRRYRILGACSPMHAYEALKHEDKIGTMLPCNVIVQEKSEGEIEVAAVDPVASMQAVGNPNLAEIANEIREKLKAVIDKLS